MYKSNLYRYHQSSQQEDDSSSDQRIDPVFVKSAVFNQSKPALIKSKNYEDENKEQNQKGNDLEEEESHLRPKLKIEQKLQIKYKDENEKNNQKCMENVSGLMGMKKQSMSQANILKKAVNAAYTFKLKSPNPNTRKKSDPVSLFQQTSSSWKKDKFLTSRTDLKQGRKLQLQKRSKQYV